MTAEIQEPEIQVVEQPTAVRIIVTFKAKVNAGNFSAFDAEAMAIVDLPPQTTTDTAVSKAGELWKDLHTEFGKQIATTISEPRDNWNKIAEQPDAMKPIITVFKTMWGNISAYLSNK